MSKAKELIERVVAGESPRHAIIEAEVDPKQLVKYFDKKLKSSDALPGYKKHVGAMVPREYAPAVQKRYSLPPTVGLRRRLLDVEIPRIVDGDAVGSGEELKLMMSGDNFHWESSFGEPWSAGKVRGRGKFKTAEKAIDYCIDQIENYED